MFRKKINFFYIKSKNYFVFYIRIYSHSLRFKIDKINNKWRFDFLHQKLDNLNIVGLYYEVGFLKHPEKNER